MCGPNSRLSASVAPTATTSPRRYRRDSASLSSSRTPSTDSVLGQPPPRTLSSRSGRRRRFPTLLGRISERIRQQVSPQCRRGRRVGDHRAGTSIAALRHHHPRIGVAGACRDNRAAAYFAGDLRTYSMIVLGLGREYSACNGPRISDPVRYSALGRRAVRRGGPASRCMGGHPRQSSRKRGIFKNTFTLPASVLGNGLSPPDRFKVHGHEPCPWFFSCISTIWPTPSTC